MKNRFLLFSLVFTLLVSLIFPQISFAAAPSVTTNAATSVEETTATLNGEVTAIGGGLYDKRGFELGDATGDYNIGTSTETGAWTTTGTFNHATTSLSQGTLYYFRAYAASTTEPSMGYGGEVTFLTKPDEPTGLAITAKTKDSISLSWTKGAGVDNTVIMYKTGAYPADISDGTQGCKDSGSSCDVSALSNGQIYYFRAWSSTTDGGLTQHSDFKSDITDYTNPGDISSLDARGVSVSGISLSWTKGTGGDKTLVRHKKGSYPDSVTDGTQVYFDTGTYITDSGLGMSTAYYYRAWAYDSTSAYYSDFYSQDSAKTYMASSSNPPDIFFDSLVIANGAEYTQTREVELNLKVNYVTYMTICNNSNFINCSLESYQQTKSWVLTEGDGLKTVYAKFISPEGANSSIVSDTIILETIPAEEIPEEPAAEEPAAEEPAEEPAVEEPAIEEPAEEPAAEEPAAEEELVKPISEMNVSEIKIKIQEIQQMIVGLLSQLIQLIQSQISAFQN